MDYYYSSQLYQFVVYNLTLPGTLLLPSFPEFQLDHQTHKISVQIAFVDLVQDYMRVIIQLARIVYLGFKCCK